MSAEPVPYTAADFARDVSRISVRATGEVNSLAQGMWNPKFCARDATHEAAAFCADLRSLVEHIEKRALLAQPEEGPAT